MRAGNEVDYSSSVSKTSKFFPGHCSESDPGRPQTAAPDFMLPKRHQIFNKPFCIEMINLFLVESLIGVLSTSETASFIPA